jgi:Tfp pilus assembly protein FimT
LNNVSIFDTRRRAIAIELIHHAKVSAADTNNDNRHGQSGSSGDGALSFSKVSDLAIRQNEQHSVLLPARPHHLRVEAIRNSSSCLDNGGKVGRARQRHILNGGMVR